MNTFRENSHSNGTWTDHKNYLTVDEILSALDKVEKRGEGKWMACCPAHNDHTPSLSIRKGKNGRAILHCFADCSIPVVVAAIRERLPYRSGKKKHRKRCLQHPSTSCATGKYKRSQKHPPKMHASLEEAIAPLISKNGPVTHRWSYHNIDGEEVGCVLRWDRRDRKIILPLTRISDGWIMMAMPTPRPLYRLPEVLRAECLIVICEGEKAADAAVSLGYNATTSAGGCNAVKQTDWSVLAGMECIILPDNDPPGEKFAGCVVGQLQSLDPKPVIKIVYLPDLPPKGDIVEFIDARRKKNSCDDDAEVLQQVRQAIDQFIRQTDPLELDDLEDDAEVAENEWESNGEGEEHCDLAFQPFPVEVFPKPIRIYIESAAASIGCDPSLVAVPLLAAFASAIGRTRRIQIKRSWREPAVLWTVIVGESGTSKSPALDAALEFVRRRESRFMKENEEARKEYERTLAAFEHQPATSKRGNGRNDSGGRINEKTIFDRPDEPVAKRFLIDNVTIEGLIALAAPNPRGLFMARDELATWIGGFDRYAKNGGGEAAIWIQTFGCRPITVDRKTSGTICCEAPTISITGGIQPDTLRRMLGREHRENGLAARIFFAWPPRKPRRWTDTEVDPQAYEQVERIFESLFLLEAMEDESGHLQPVDLPLTRDGREAWIKFFNEHGLEAENLVGEMNRVWSKLECGAARLALIIHELRVAANDSTLQNPNAIDAVSIRAGVQISRWFGHESQRVYAMLDESEAEKQQRTFLEVIQRKQAAGKRITPRLLQRSLNSFRTANAAKQALDELVEGGWGEWVFDPSKPTGGRPSRSFRLFDNNQCTSASDNTPDHAS